MRGLFLRTWPGRRWADFNRLTAWRGREEGAQTIVVRSDDGGDSWDRIDPGFPEIEKHYAEAIAIHPSEPDRMFLATRSGALYHSPDAGETWADLKVRVPEVADMKAVEA